tara:strand:+ start:939 stop:2273 length:1335 start_codon:yes stop_codon:yes gene_type:complete
MARTYTQLRQLTIQQTGLLFITGTVDSSGSSTGILQADELTRYADKRLNGHHILLTSGSPSFSELYISDFFQEDGQARFRPELNEAPSSLTFEVLPFSATNILQAIRDAILEQYDLGLLSRDFWMHMVGGSPIYNADFSYWTSTTALDGWTATTTTVTQERSSVNLALSETSAKLGTAAGYLALNGMWKRYLSDFKEQSLTFYCLVKSSAASNARINLYNGSDNYSAYHSGNGNWELLHVEVSTTETDTDIEPRLYIDTTSDAYFNLPFISGSAHLIRTYPFPIVIMPDGPTEITTVRLDLEEDQLASGRGLTDIRQLHRSRPVLDWRMVKHHDANTTTQVGILDLSASRRPPSDDRLLWLRGDGPLTIPTTVTSTDNIEVTEMESLLLASAAAIKLLERATAMAPESVRRLHAERLTQLRNQYASLAGGAGEARSVATYGLGW